ncbi:MAG: hypothetical protein M0Z56_02030, partial [Desulfobacteraceae bacterium]|nr:hypothetical protein [Desulfobacteraceae bacterium]
MNDQSGITSDGCGVYIHVPFCAKKCAYSFVLLPPQLHLALLGGEPEVQGVAGADELGKLKSI